jgi:hypothetical protein
MVKPPDISIVVQGALTEGTAAVLSALRKTLPGAELILSTYEGANTQDLDFDKLVLSPDPGGFIQNRGLNVINNVNRQIVSTLAGLKVSDKEYALKIRTDILLESAGFLEYFHTYDTRSPPTLFKARVLICAYYSRNPRAYPVPFHPSDWLFFAKTEDLRNYFDIPLMEDWDALWFDSHKRQSRLFKDNVCRYFPEQWLCINFIRKYISVGAECFYDISHGNVKQTERFFAENTVVLEPEQWGITFTKYNPDRYGDAGSLIGFKDWQTLYGRYCLGEKGLGWVSYTLKGFLKGIDYGYLRPALALCLGRLGIKRWVMRRLRAIRGKSKRQNETHNRAAA